MLHCLGMTAFSDEDSLDTVFVPKCLCIISHYPFYDHFAMFLKQIYRICNSQQNPIPLEVSSKLKTKDCERENVKFF